MQSQPQQQSPILAFPLQSPSWLPELQKTGVVVLSQILSQQQVLQARSQFWQWLQSLDTGVKREQPETWGRDNWPGLENMGFFASYGGAHTKASWGIRSNERVRKAFENIWGTKQLISSFDTFIGWKPWWVNKDWKPKVENLHVDQNPFYKKGLKCVQGMIPLYRVRQSQVGGLMVVPNTNNDKTQQQLSSRYKFTQYSDSDWVELLPNDPFITEKRGKLIECEAGDLILWDSRSVHGGKVCEPSQQFKQQNKKDLVRLSMTVTMVPRQWASQEVLEKRRKGFEDKVGLTHWPHQFNKSGMGGFLKGVRTSQIKYDWPTYEQVKELV